MGTAKGKGVVSRRTITVEAHVDKHVEAEVDISDLPDEELMACVEEARTRGLLGGVPVGSRRDRLLDVYHALVARRHGNVLEAFERAVFPYEDDWHLVECWRALQRGEYSAAVCFLDREIYSESKKAKAEAS